MLWDMSFPLWIRLHQGQWPSEPKPGLKTPPAVSDSTAYDSSSLQAVIRYGWQEHNYALGKKPVLLDPVYLG